MSEILYKSNHNYNYLLMTITWLLFWNFDTGLFKINVSELKRVHTASMELMEHLVSIHVNTQNYFNFKHWKYLD